METVNLLILDYDGTLADCKELHQQAFRKACMKVNNAIRYTNEEVEGMPTFVKIDYLKAKGYQFVCLSDYNLSKSKLVKSR